MNDTARDDVLRTTLDLLQDRYGATYLETDPVCFPRRYPAPEDREVAAFLATALAYGRVAQIKKSLDRIGSVLGPRPAAFIRKFDPVRHRPVLSGFVHRFNDATDLGLLLYFLRQMLRRNGSLEGFFLAGYQADHEDIGPALSSFVARALALDCTPWHPSGKLPARAGVRFFLPSPADGSTCKRLNLFLRWMVRPDDGVDMGLWSGVRASQLVIPLDTHVSRISMAIGLTSRRTIDWKMACEVTARLRRIEPADPVRYDFALCRLGMLESCPRHADPSSCPLCGPTPARPVARVS